MQADTAGQDVGENQQSVAVRSYAGTTLPNEDGRTSRQGQASGLAGDAAEGKCQQDTCTKELQWWRENGTQEDITPKIAISYEFWPPSQLRTRCPRSTHRILSTCILTFISIKVQSQINKS